MEERKREGGGGRTCRKVYKKKVKECFFFPSSCRATTLYKESEKERERQREIQTTTWQPLQVVRVR